MPPPTPSYAKLIKAIKLAVKKGLENIERYAHQQKVVTYHNVGNIINAESIERGAVETFYNRLADGTGIHVRTLQQCAQFNREYPDFNPDLPLRWSHYRYLLLLPPEERRTWEKRIIKDDLDTNALKALIIDAKVSTAAPVTVDESKIIRGRLYTYRMIKVTYALDAPNGFLVDCGFNSRIIPPKAEGILDNTRIVTSLKDEAGQYTLKLSKSTIKEIYTYKAMIERVIDADTMIVNIDLGFGMYIQQILRLRGIDAPQRRTETGGRAQRFVLDELKDCPFVVIKTYKTDKYDRYLVDIFYDASLSDPHEVAAKGKFLNNELLKRGLVIPWSP